MFRLMLKFLAMAARDFSRASVMSMLALAVVFTLFAPTLTLTTDEALHHQSHVQIGFLAPVTDAHSEAVHRTCLECQDHAWANGEHVTNLGLPPAIASSQIVFFSAENADGSIDHGPLPRPPRA